jgi:hypothetical protein
VHPSPRPSNVEIREEVVGVAIFEELRRRGVGFTSPLKRTPTLQGLRLEIPSSAVVANVNHRRLRERLEQLPEPPPRPAAARVAAHNTKLVRRWLLAVPGRILHSRRRVVLRLAQDMLCAATFIAAYQRLRLLTSA